MARSSPDARREAAPRLIAHISEMAWHLGMKKSDLYPASFGVSTDEAADLIAVGEICLEMPGRVLARLVEAERLKPLLTVLRIDRRPAQWQKARANAALGEHQLQELFAERAARGIAERYRVGTPDIVTLQTAIVCTRTSDKRRVAAVIAETPVPLVPRTESDLSWLYDERLDDFLDEQFARLAATRNKLLARVERARVANLPRVALMSDRLPLGPPYTKGEISRAGHGPGDIEQADHGTAMRATVQEYPAELVARTPRHRRTFRDVPPTRSPWTLVAQVEPLPEMHDRLRTHHGYRETDGRVVLTGGREGVWSNGLPRTLWLTSSPLRQPNNVANFAAELERGAVIPNDLAERIGCRTCLHAGALEAVDAAIAIRLARHIQRLADGESDR
jgi:hypothetical protein